MRKERCAQRTYVATNMTNLPCATFGQAKIIADTLRVLLEKPDEVGEAIVVRTRFNSVGIQDPCENKAVCALAQAQNDCVLSWMIPWDRSPQGSGCGLESINC